MITRITEASVEEVVNEVLEKTLVVDLNEITPGAKLAEDLGADSMDFIETCLCLEERFGIEIRDSDGEKLTTVQDVYDLVNAKWLRK